MSDQNLKVEWGFKEEMTMRMLFGEEIGGLAKDGFEGSKDEHQTAMEVLYGTTPDDASNCNAVSVTMNFQPDRSICTKSLVNLMGESSVRTSCMKDSFEEAFKHAKINSQGISGSGYVRGSSSWAQSDTYNTNTKRMKLSSVELLNHKNKEPVPYSMHLFRQTPCCIVESVGQGTISSYYPFGHQQEVDGDSGIDNGTISKNNYRNQQIRDDKEVIPAKSVTSPFSLETYSPGPSVTDGSVSLEETPRELICMSQRAQELTIRDSDTVGVAQDRDLRTRLRKHAHHLLIDVGWEIETSKRKDGKVDYDFKIHEEGLVIHSLPKAWRSCGERLFANSLNSEQDENGRQWLGINEFWGDLGNTLAYIEKEMQHPGNSPSLPHRWKLLDPFVAVVCIDTKIGALRKGRALKAVRSATFDLSREKEAVDEVEDLLAETSSFSLGNLSQSFLPALKSDSKLEVIKSSCNQEVFALQGCYGLKNKRSKRMKYATRKFCCAGEIRKRSLKSMARRIGKRLCDATDMNCRASSKPPKKTSRSPSKFNSIEDDSCFSFTVALPASVVSPQASATPVMRTSTPYDPMSDKVTFTDKFADCTAPESGAPGKLLVRNQPCKEIAIDQQKSVLYPKGKKLQGKDGHHKEEGHAHELVQLESSASHGSSSREFSSDEGDMIGDGLDYPVIQEKERIQVLEDQLKEVTQESTINSGYTGNSLYEHPVLGQQVLFLYPQEGTLCFAMGDNCTQEMFALENTPDAIGGVDLQQEVQASVCQTSLIRGVLLIGIDRSIIHNLDCSIQQEELHPVPQDEPAVAEKGLALSILKESEYHTQMIDGAFGASKSTLKQKSASMPVRGSAKKAPKKSKKISEIAASRIPEVGSTKNTHNNPGKSETKSAKQCSKDKKGGIPISLEVESGNILLKSDIDPEDVAHNRSTKSERNEKMVSSTTSPSLGSSQQKSPSKFKKAQHQFSGFKESVDAEFDCMIPTKPHHKKDVDQALLLANNEFPDTPKSQVVTKAKTSEVRKENGRKRLHGCQINDDDLLIAAIIKTKSSSSNIKHSASKVGSSQSKALRKLKSRKGSRKLLLRTPGKGGKHSVDGKRFFLGVRTVLCWLIETGVVSLNDTVQYRDPKRNTVVKDGWITRDGILCNCCTKVLSLSEFKIHAGLKLHRSPLNLFLESGRPYTLCQLQAWSAEYKVRRGGTQVMEVEEVDQHDDSCGLCGDGGELMCCDNCPSTYHQACLSAQELPKGSWYCPNCTCDICGDVVNAKAGLSSLSVLECSQCEQKYHDTCIKEKIAYNGEVGSDTWFCGGNCHEVYIGLRSRVGVMNYVGDGFSWTILRCIHGDQKVRSAKKIALMAESNTKLAIALNIMEECFLPIVDPRTGIDMIPHVLYNWGSKFARLDYQGFYTVVLEKGDELISVASIRVHGVTVAEMPLIATCSERRRLGMCRRLMGAIEEMLRSFKVEMLVLSAIPSLVDTWTSGFGFKPIGDDEKKRLGNINLMLFPGTVLLKKSLCETATKELGNAGGDSKLYSGEDKSQNLWCFERTDIVTGQQSAENSRIELEAESLLPICMELPVEQVNDQQRYLLMSSCGNFVSTTRDSGHGDVSNVVSCKSKLGTSNIYEMHQSFSTEQTVPTQMSVANVCSVVRSSSGSFSSLATDNELPTEPSSNKSHVIIGDREGRAPDINILTEDSAADDVNKERKMNHSEGGETEQKNVFGTSERKFGGYYIYQGLPEEDLCLEAPDLNKLNLRELNNSRVSVDDYSSMSIDEMHGSFVRRLPVADRCNPGNVEAHTTFSACIEQRRYLNMPHLESARIDPNQVETISVSGRSSRCQGMSDTSAEKYLGEKEICGTCINGQCGNGKQAHMD